MRIFFLYNFLFLYYCIENIKISQHDFFKLKFDFHIMLRFYLKNHSSSKKDSFSLENK